MHAARGIPPGYVIPMSESRVLASACSVGGDRRVAPAVGTAIESSGIESSGIESSGDEARPIESSGIESSGAEAASPEHPRCRPHSEVGTAEAGTVSTPATVGLAVVNVAVTVLETTLSETLSRVAPQSRLGTGTPAGGEANSTVEEDELAVTVICFCTQPIAFAVPVVKPGASTMVPFQ